MYMVTQDYLNSEGETFDKLSEAETVYIVRDYIVDIKETKSNER